MSNSVDKIVFYDGDCGFCNRSVAFVLKYDKTKSICFASIQSKFTENLFAERGFEKPDLSTFYFLEGEILLSKSKAAIRLANYMRFPQNLIKVTWIIPHVIRDLFYDFIAKRRQKLAKGYCVMPSAEDNVRFLD